MAVNNNTSPILHNSHIINNNHQHLHQSNMTFGSSNGGQMLNNDLQNATAYYQQQHQFMQQQQRDGNVMINNSMSLGHNHPTNGIAQHMKGRSRVMKNNGLNNNFYRSSGTKLDVQNACCSLLLFSFIGSELFLFRFFLR